MKNNPFSVIIIVLALFLCVGIFLTIFMIIQDVKIVGAYITTGLFIIFPALLIYGLTKGFRVSEKSLQSKEKYRETISADGEGFVLTMPLFETTQIIPWHTIDTVVYNRPIDDDKAYFTFNLSTPPIQSSEKPRWFLNRLFSRLAKNVKYVIVNDECRNFYDIPAVLQKHLGNVDASGISEDHRKGTMIYAETKIKGNSVTRIERWKPDGSSSMEKIIYDRKRHSGT